MKIDPMLQKQVQQLPLQPGVYQFFDESGRLLYIGKATQLRTRVQSYFRDSTHLSNAKLYMVHQIREVRVTLVDHEPEALLLETTLIKKHKPPYNVVMKDDKNFQFIHITDDLYPQLEVVRTLPLGMRTGFYAGPYISGTAVRHLLRLLQSLFHFCSTPPQEHKGTVVMPQRPCLQYHLGRCVGPCAGDVTPEVYRQIFDQIRLFLEGDYQPIRRRVMLDMKRASQTRRFEAAARLRDQLQSIDRLMQEQKVVSAARENADYLSLVRQDAMAAINLFVVRNGHMIHQDVFFMQHVQDQSDEDVLQAFQDQYYAQSTSKPATRYMNTEVRRGRHRKLLEMGVLNAEQALKQYTHTTAQKKKKAEQALSEVADALQLNGVPLHRIEVYDISHFQGSHTVASMIVFIDGQPAPQQYRKFTIRTVEGPNDVASMREVMNRRVKHLDRKGKKTTQPWPRPDLIIVDGGKPQLNATAALLHAAHIDIPIVALAKRQEELFLPGVAASIRLPQGSEGLHVVQRMRDEAHRFAIGFYRSRHLHTLTEE